MITAHRGGDWRGFVDRLVTHKQPYRKLAEQGCSNQVLNDAPKIATKLVSGVEEAIGRSTRLAVDAFTIADIVVSPTTVRLDHLGYAQLWADAPAMAGWYERVQARPSFAQAYPVGSRFTELPRHISA